MTSKALRSAALLLPIVALTTGIAGAAPNDKPAKKREATLEEKQGSFGGSVGG
jgi:hypothetical protein